MNISNIVKSKTDNLRSLVSDILSRFQYNRAIKSMEKDLKKRGFNFNPTLEERMRWIYTDVD